MTETRELKKTDRKLGDYHTNKQQTKPNDRAYFIFRQYLHLKRKHCRVPDKFSYRLQHRLWFPCYLGRFMKNINFHIRLRFFFTTFYEPVLRVHVEDKF